MGEIFLARLEGAAGFEKLCVIKRILPHLADDPRFRTMLVDEARIAANMSHPNICHVYELDETDRQLFIAMEYLEGATLLALLRKFARSSRQLEAGFIGGVVAQVAAGLHYAHELRDREGQLLGVVHRDVSPSNIFLTEGGVIKVHDFGVAKVKNAATTETGTLKGKFAYMPPEQLQGGQIDRRVDVYALGVVIAEMMIGRPLFQRRTEYLTFRAVMEQPLPDLAALRPDLPPALVAVVTKALSRSSEERYATARQLGAAVVQTLTGEAAPWSTAEIGEVVQHEFAEEIEHHNSKIASVITRMQRGSFRTMPVIAPAASSEDDDEYFSFETDVAAEPRSVPEGFALGAAGTPLPSRLPLQAAPVTTLGAMPEAPGGPTSASGALAFVTKPIAMILAAAVAVLVIGLVIIGRGGDGTTAGARSRATGPNAAYDEAIRPHDGELARCGEGAEVPPGARAMIEVGPDGAPGAITFDPSAVADLPLGGCVRSVLAGVAFPRGTGPRTITLSLQR
jgi:serine/threonine protein kinase